MASLASLATVGSARVNSTVFSEGSHPLIGRPLYFNHRKNNCSFRIKYGHRLFRIPAYCCLATTELIDGEVKSLSSENYLKQGGRSDDDDGAVLKPSPKPMPRRVESSRNVEAGNSGLVGARWASNSEVARDDKQKEFSVSKEQKQLGNSIGNAESTEKLEAEKKDSLDGNTASAQNHSDEMLLKPSPKPMPARVEATRNVVTGKSGLVGARWAPKPEVARDDKQKEFYVSKEEKQLGNGIGNVASTEKLEAEKKDALDGNTASAQNHSYRKDRGSKTVIKSKPPSKNVWKKGNPIPNVRIAPTSTSMPSMPSPTAVATTIDINRNEQGDLETKIKQMGEQKEEQGSREVVSAASVSMQQPSPMAPPLRPTPPSPLVYKPKLTHQGKSMAVSNATVAPVKKVILKDVGAAPKQIVLRDIGASSNTGKNPATDVDAPVLPSKGGNVSQARDDWGKKKRPVLGLRKPEVELDDEEAEELDIPISGASGFSARKKGRKFSKASRKAERAKATRAAAPVKVEILEVGKEGMSMVELANNFAVHETEIVMRLFMKGISTLTTQILDQDTVKLVCNEYGVEVIEAEGVRVEGMARKMEMLDEDDLDKLESRPPVLTIMGHVDHGKTTLLDYMRKSKVAASEAGGITQGIGAYSVLVPVDNTHKPCVFLDTPGHEAFSAMRARGARVTDIAIIVVAADDGVRPQTNEAIAHAKAANVPVVVAINKIDKEGASPERVMQELSSIGLMPEEWGGDVPMVQVSARTGQNVNELLETVMLVAELQELKANPNRKAKGTVIEAGLHKSRGPLASFLVQNGTLKKGDVVVCGQSFGKVKSLLDDTGNRVDKAGPSIAVQVIGLNNVPVAGDEFEVVDTLDIARERAEECALKLRDERLSEQAGEAKVTLSGLADAVTEGTESGSDRHQFNIVLKVDVQGSVAAIREALSVLPQDSVNLRFLMQAVGDVSTSDVDLALASEAIIVGFNVKVPTTVQTYADHQNVEIRLYRVIYELVDDMRKAMEGLLKPAEEQVHIGSAEVRAVFSSGSGRAAGCMVTEGKVVKGCGVRVVRNGTTIYTSTLDSLRRVKEVVKEISAGVECGISLRNFDDWHVQDTIEAFNSIAKRRTLEDASAKVSAGVAATGLQQ